MPQVLHAPWGSCLHLSTQTIILLMASVPQGASLSHLMAASTRIPRTMALLLIPDPGHLSCAPVAQREQGTGKHVAVQGEGGMKGWADGWREGWMEAGMCV